MGFLRWYDQEESETPFNSPLILLPVRLEKERGFGSATYKVRFDDQALDTNYSLHEKLKHDLDITLPFLSAKKGEGVKSALGSSLF